MKNIIIGFVAILVVVAGFMFYKRLKNPQPLPTIIPTVEEENFIDKFNLQIPDDVEKTTLKDVTGGSFMGIATRDYTSGVFTHTVLADLSDPEGGLFYEGWLVRGKLGDEDYEMVSTGKMYVAKGGYLLNFDSKTDLSSYTNVVITLEKINDKTPETHILEGSF